MQVWLLVGLLSKSRVDNYNTYSALPTGSGEAFTRFGFGGSKIYCMPRMNGPAAKSLFVGILGVPRMALYKPLQRLDSD